MALTRVSKKPMPQAVPSASVQAPEFTDEELAPALGLYQILGPEGQLVVSEREVPALEPSQLLEMYRAVVLIRTMDTRLLALQRQGRIGFYGEARGQEAAVVGSAHALGSEDYIVPALREAGAALLHGLSLRAYIAQIFGNANDLSKGRQMPCHPGSRASRYVPMSSCVATQLPHAQGMAWAAKLRGDPVVVMGYLGDGATSEEEFHVAMNFAGVYQVPVVFFCQNNQWAISTPASKQTAAPTLAIKALAYGMPGIRIDGNDLLACYKVAKEAVERARAGGGPTFIEALTYRMGAHSSSDDPTRYRDEGITEEWSRRDPIERFRKYLAGCGLLDAEADAQLHDQVSAEVADAIAAEEGAATPVLETLIEDVFATVPAHLREQLDEHARLGKTTKRG